MNTSPNKRTSFSVRIQPTLIHSIKLKAVEENTSISDIIETAVKKYLEV